MFKGLVVECMSTFLLGNQLCIILDQRKRKCMYDKCVDMHKREDAYAQSPKRVTLDDNLIL